MSEQKSVLKPHHSPERLDKILASQGCGTRSECQRLIRSGKVTVDGKPVKDPSQKFIPDTCEIVVAGKSLSYKKYLYIMLNKPAGLLCVSRDPHAPTVMELLPPEYRRQGLFPAGRLDKDTVGLVIITDDGDFAHRMLAPKKEVFKRYQAIVDAPVTQREIEAFANGTTLEDGTLCKTAKLCVLREDDTPLVEIAITEGRFHQIKRMFRSVDRHVLWLKRVSIGGLELDPSLEEGTCREISSEELDRIFE